MADDEVQIVDRVRPPPVPAAHRVDVVLLVADVSRFTALTVALEKQHGRRGADRLAQVMDTLLGTLAVIAQRHGGRVLDIVGDAAQVAWTVGDDGISACLDRAAATALAMLRSGIRGRALGETPQLRIGIATGTLMTARFGAARDTELAWGSAILAASRAASLAPIGSCAIGAHDVEPLDPAFVTTPGAGGMRFLAPFADASGAAAEALEMIIPPTSWSAELRTASVLFCRLISADEAPRASVERVARLVNLVQTVTAARGGILDKVHADDKGIAAVIAFGVPPDPVAEAATRCLGAAVDLRRELRERGVDVAIGVASGKVRSGFGGGEDAVQHILYGSTVNLAARCMQACNDEILSDGATRLQTAQAFEFFVAEPRLLKGFGGGTTVFGVGEQRVVQAVEEAGGGQPLAGRRRECAVIDAFLTGSDERLLLIAGERGIGKSRLALHALDCAAALGHATLVAFGDPLAGQNPLFAWRRPALHLLRDWARERDLSLDEALLALTDRAGRSPSQVTLLAALFGRNAPVSGSGQARIARRLQAAVLIDLFTPVPRLIVIEDAHWLDEASVNLARELIEMQPTLRIILVSRPALAPSVQALLDTDAVPTQRLLVGGLDPADFAEVMRHVAGPLDDGHPAIEWFYDRCSGNPLFGGELLRAVPSDVLAAGLRTPGAWRDAEVALRDLDLPQTIEAAAAVRLDAQPPGRMALLKAASVMGGSFDAEAVLALGTPLAPDDVMALLDALVREQILTRSDAGERPAWRFAQELLREVIYGSLPDSMRQELHLRAVRHLQSGGIQRADRLSNQIAHHLLAAGQSDLAFRPMRRAAIAARRAGAHAEALQCFSSALTLCPPVTAKAAHATRLRRAQLHLDLSHTHWDLGEIDRAILHGSAALDGMWRGMPATRLAWARFAGSELAQLSALILTPPRWHRSPAAMHRRVADRLRTATAMNLSDNLLFSKGSLQSVAMALYAARTAERLGDRQLSAAPYALLGYVAGLLRLPKVARFCFERPREQCIAARNRRGLGRLLGGESLYHLAMGRWEAMERCLALADVPAKRERTDRDYGLGITIWGLAQLLQGNLASAGSAAAALHRIALLHADDQYLLWWQELEVRLILARGDLDAARSAVEAAQTLSSHVDDRQSALIAAAQNAMLQARSRDLAPLAAQSMALLDRADAAPTAWGSWDGFGGIAEAQIALLASDDNAANRAGAARALKRLRSFARAYAFARPLSALHHGQYAAVTGRRLHGVRVWRRGLAVAERLGTRLEAARLHDALAQATGDPLHARAAETLATDCGAVIPPLPIAPFQPRKVQ